MAEINLDLEDMDKVDMDKVDMDKVLDMDLLVMDLLDLEDHQDLVLQVLDRDMTLDLEELVIHMEVGSMLAIFPLIILMAGGILACTEEELNRLDFITLLALADLEDLASIIKDWDMDKVDMDKVRADKDLEDKVDMDKADMDKDLEDKDLEDKVDMDKVDKDLEDKDLEDKVDSDKDNHLEDWAQDLKEVSEDEIEELEAISLWSISMILGPNTSSNSIFLAIRENTSRRSSMAANWLSTSRLIDWNTSSWSTNVNEWR